MHKHPLVYFSNHVLEAIKRAKTFEALRDLALFVLATMPRDVGMVCGPITTGGAGSVEKNLSRFNYAINLMFVRGFNVFTQMPFKTPMQRIKENKDYYKGGNQLLETFYLALFRSCWFKTLYFLPDWKSSYGARWEHEQALALGLEIKYFKENFESLGQNESLFVE